MNHRGETVCATQLRNENRSQRRGFNYAICEEEARACISNRAILRHLPMGEIQATLREIYAAQCGAEAG